nr:MAG TPA: tail-collar fiber protein [Caudoviricetes sp.]
MAEDPNTGFKEKLKQTILTDAGRHIFLSVGNGVGTLVYTRAILSSQKPVNSSGQALDDEAIRQITSLPDDLKEGQLTLTPVTDDHFDVIADFNNKNQPADINFSCIGWYARVDSTNEQNQKVQGDEALIAITFTTNDHETLAAGSPDGLSTDVISAQLSMTIAEAANIDMTVNEVGYVTRAELNSWQTKVTADFNGKIDANEKNTTITIHGTDPVKADANRTFDLNTYTKQEIDQMVAGAGKGAGINTVQGVAPDSTGNVNLSSVFYPKADVDRAINDLKQTITSLQSANNTKDQQIKDLNNQITGLNNQQGVSTRQYNDLLNRVIFLEQNSVIGKRFAASQETEAEAWENQHPNYLAMIEK